MCVVTFGEAKRVHCQSTKDCDRVLGNDSIDELYKHKNLGAVKSYMAHSPPMWMKISIRLERKRASYSLRILITENCSQFLIFTLDLAGCLHVQVRRMGNFGLNASIPWVKTTNSPVCFICKVGEETLYHFLFECTGFREHFDLLFCSNLTTKLISSNPTDGSHMSDFLVNLEQHQKALLLIGCLPLPFDLATIMMITRFVASAVVKIYNLSTDKLFELQAPWITKYSLVEFTACSYSRFKLAF